MSAAHLTLDKTAKSYRLYTLGEYGIVLEIDDTSVYANTIAAQRSLISFADSLRAAVKASSVTNSHDSDTLHLNQLLASITDIVPAQLNLTIALCPARLHTQRDLNDCTQLIERWWIQHSNTLNDNTNNNTDNSASTDARTIRVPVVYGGEDTDLTSLADTLNLSPEEIIDLHSSAQYHVMFLGFQPGFAYLHGLANTLQVPRRITPRSHVRAGSLAISGEMTAIYPFASPGGWQIIGRLSTQAPSLFDSQREAATLFKAGDRVEFIAVEN